MPKTLVPFAVPDLSPLAKSLRSQLASLDHPPTHVEMLNLLAKAGGYSNFQSLRADVRADAGPATPSDRIARVIRHFDAEGRMQRWPGKTSHQDLCLWVLWSRIPPGQDFSERDINALIQAGHSFGDHALLRRSLVDMKMLARTQDGRIYHRIEKQPDADARALMDAINPRLPA